ncbi:PEP-CTERM sorting domain-containing protein [Duganella sp. LX20W]|uniref:PEP-CTERM sorting domain-containing protein n=1 Tax=Rugamonas brunnea TaxID=2758569 RepID=A0A7W2EP00_9BURK|nr:DVUA0089 family protein [Rugamonas brunnea]MBA5635824.1 PEP-CTERM sorting domain-containing protein [Rugamonas brunnea]
MRKFNLLLGSALLAAVAAAPSHAADFNFSGTIRYQKDVIQIPFTLNQDATDVKVWTDSYLNGVNFDPITAVWKDGLRVGQNDDDPTIAPGQTRYDSGLTFHSLTAGNYLFTIAAYNNFSNGLLLSQGFRFDHDDAIPLANWDQPASHRGMGPNWSVHLSGVDGATPPPVPEPESYAMLVAGLGLLAAVARRKNKA